MPGPTGKYLSVGVAFLALSACSKPQTALQEVEKSGELRVLTRNAVTCYYEGPEGPAGMEYDLAQGFADELGVQLKMIVAANLSEALGRLAEGEAHLAAAGLTITGPRKVWARFTPPYQEITQQLVYRVGTPPPHSLGELNGQLEVLANSSHAERLRQLKSQFPELSWTENKDAQSEEMLTLVSEGVIDYTIGDSNEVILNQRFYPELRVAFDIGDPQPLAWAFPKFQDDSLYKAAVAYFEKIKTDGRLAQLLERHYGHVDDFDYVGTRTYQRHIMQRLPRYQALFEKAAAETGLDWRLLAAVAYQESHWDPKAVSPTGVRGIMMLTQATAKHLGVDKRTDPIQSIEGGARYLKDIMDRIPEQIGDPDRMWLALAAYNVGLGHLEDARIITEKRNGNPDRWLDIKENLPLLRKKKWYRNTKHGYARGNEAVLYVENIRSYYDILVWLTDRDRPEPVPDSDALTISNPVL